MELQVGRGWGRIHSHFCWLNDLDFFLVPYRTCQVENTVWTKILRDVWIMLSSQVVCLPINWLEFCTVERKGWRTVSICICHLRELGKPLATRALFAITAGFDNSHASFRSSSSLFFKMKFFLGEVNSKRMYTLIGMGLANPIHFSLWPAWLQISWKQWASWMYVLSWMENWGVYKRKEGRKLTFSSLKWICNPLWWQLI